MAKAPNSLTPASLAALEPQGRALFAECLSRSRAYLEYGCGGSTIQAAQAGVPEIFSIDTDHEWIAQVGAVLQALRRGSQLIHCDLGPVRDWGYPISGMRFQKFHRYPIGPWDAAKAAGQSPDLVLVDGRYRVVCFLYSLVSAAQGTTILFDDYVNRPHYHVVEEFLKPAGFAGHMARFEVTGASLDSRDLMRRFAEHLTVPH